MGQTLKVGSSASLRARATRSWISAFVMLRRQSASTLLARVTTRRRYLPEGLRKGEHGKRRHEPVDNGLVRHADGLLLSIWRRVRPLRADNRRIGMFGPAPVDHPLRGKRKFVSSSTSTNPAWVIQAPRCRGALGSFAGRMLCI